MNSCWSKRFPRPAIVRSSARGNQPAADSGAELAPKRLPDRGAEIVIYCASPTCHAAGNAARELVALGYTNVKEFPGGKEEWRDAELPLER